MITCDKPPVVGGNRETGLAVFLAQERAREYVESAISANTRRGYGSDWRSFTIWCAQTGRTSLPAAPETVAIYAIHLVELGRKTSTLQRHLTAIGQLHKTQGHPSPTADVRVKTICRGIRRSKGTAPKQVAALSTSDLVQMVKTRDDSAKGLRDRALLLLGFAGAFRRSELVALDVEDVTLEPQGAVVTIRRSKTDQEGAGRKVGIPWGSSPESCPVRTLQAWMEAAGIQEGPLFRSVRKGGRVREKRLSDHAVAVVVKQAAEAAGLDPDRYSGHSLRAGLATSAAAAGASERSIMKQTGHRSVQMVRRYIRDGSLFRENAASSLGL